MGLQDILAAGVKIADGVTKGVQVDVTHEAWIGQDGYGADQYDSPVTLKAIVDTTRKQRATTTGRLVNIVATVTILQAVEDNGVVTTPPRREPIDPRDKLTLPDGTTGPILESPGAVLNPSTGRGFINTIMLGEIGENKS